MVLNQSPYHNYTKKISVKKFIMTYKIHPDLKPLSANLKRLNIGKSFIIKDFEYLLEENNFDDLWGFCKKESGYMINVLTSNLDEKYSEIFIIGLNTTYVRFLSPIENHKITAKKIFNSFFEICFNFYLNNNFNKFTDYSKLIFILKKLQILDKLTIENIEKEISKKKFYTNIEVKKLISDKDLIIKNKETTSEIIKYQIFISSTYIDLKEERQATVEAILKKGHIPAGMELFSANNKSQWEVIEKWIDNSDIYVLLLGGRYGSIDNETNLSYTEMEYDYAIKKNKPFFALVLDDQILNNKPADIIEKYEFNNPKYINFKEKIIAKMCAFPKNIDQIKTEINNSLDESIKDNKHKMFGWIKGSI